MIKLIVDSASDVDATEAEQLGVSLIPLQVRFGSEEFSDGVNLTDSFSKNLSKAPNFRKRAR